MKNYICLKCGKEFNCIQTVDGVVRINYARKYCYECVKPYERLNTKVVNGMKTCTRCKKEQPITEYFPNGKNHIHGRCKTCFNEDQRAWFAKTKQDAITYKGGKCVVCGYSKCSASLDFHHRDMTQKEFTISEDRRSLESIKKELDKCDLICANCHRELHYNLTK